MPGICWNTLFFWKNCEKKLPKNAQKREKNRFSHPISRIHTTAQGFRDNQIGPIEILKEYS